MVIIGTIAVISIAIFLLACSFELPRQVSPAAEPAATTVQEIPTSREASPCAGPCPSVRCGS